MMIRIGNDELILYIRKNYKLCEKTNDRLGKMIWEWLKNEYPESEKVAEDQPCAWGDTPNITSPITLPKTAAQFRISREILPALYEQLEIIAES